VLFLEGFREERLQEDDVYLMDLVSRWDRNSILSVMIAAKATNK
jgi:hypothetical protein